MESIPGPMLGPFDSHSEAVIATCQRIFEKPHSSAGLRPSATALREEQVDFNLRWRISTEYCAWLYYSPDDNYLVSKLTSQTRPDPTGQSKRCFLPSSVDDPRYPPESLKHIIVLHNHPYDTPISRDDVLFIVSQGLRHGFVHRTKEGDVMLSIVAFFSNEHAHPTCDGLYTYSPGTNRVLKWTRDQSLWHCEQTHVVRWWADGSFNFDIAETKGPCPQRGTP